MTTIRFQLLILVACVTLPGLLFGLGASWWLASEMRTQTETDARHKVAEAATNISEHVKLEIVAMKMLARLPPIEKEDFAESYRYTRLLATDLGEHVGLSWADGRQIFNTRRPFGTKLPRRSDATSYMRALRTGLPSVSNIIIGAIAGKPLISIDLPVQTVSGFVVLGTSTDVGVIAAILARTKLSEGWKAAVVDGEGRFMARNINPEQYVGKIAVPEIIAVAKSDQRHGKFNNRTHEGIELVSFFRKVEGTDWTVVIGTPEPVLLAPLRGPLGLLASLGAAAICLTLAAAYIVGRRLSHAARKIKSETEQQQTERSLFEARTNEARRLESLGHLAGGIAHDFNNLLGAILGFARFIIEDSDPEHPAHRHATRIEVIAQRGATLVAQILTFARQSRTELTCFDLSELAAESEPLLRIAAPGNIEINMNLRAGSTVEANRGQISQLLMNLCLNSRDAMEGGVGSITVRVAPTEMDCEEVRRLATHTEEVSFETWEVEDGTVCTILGCVRSSEVYVSLIVSDTGSGMDAMIQRRIFEPFFSTRTKGASRGTGLGMSVVRGIVMSHLGAILVRSRLGEGTEIEVLFPLCVREPTQEACLPYPNEAEWECGCRGRVLVVDDDEDYGEVLCQGLKRKGWIVELCVSPEEGMVALELDGPWDVMVTDQVMPGMPGIELVRRARVTAPTMICILCTGYDDTIDEDAARTAGAVALMHKPVDLDELCRTFSHECRSASQ